MRIDRIACITALFAAATAAVPQPRPAQTTFHDPIYGVTFTYPKTWKADRNLQSFYLMTDILHPNSGSDASETSYEQALMTVQFLNTETTGYEGTNLDGAEFVYFVLPQTTRAACYARIQDVAEPSDRKPANVAIRRTTYLHLSTGDAGLGHGASRQLYAAYVGTLCYLFEEGIHTSNGGDTKFLTSKQNLTLKSQLAAIMQSVRIDPQTH